MESHVAELPLIDRLWAWFETNKKPVLLATTLMVVAGFVIGFVVWRKEQSEIAASNALSNVAAGLLTGVSSRADSAQAYLKVAASYPNSTAAARASLLAAGSLFVEGKYAEAQAQFEKFIHSYQGSPFTGEALMGVGASLEAQNKTDQAITNYKDLIARQPNSSVIPQAKLALGRLYEAQGKPELAQSQYEEAERAAIPFSTLANDAGMRLEELKAKYPGLAHPAPPSVPAPMLAPVPATSAPVNAPAK